MKWSAVAVAVIAGVFCARVTLVSMTSSATFDEPEYITAGYSYIATHQLRLELWHPPLAFALAGLAVRARFDLAFTPDPISWMQAEPRHIARRFIYAETNDADAIIHAARIPSLVFGLATILLVGAWAAQLWGARAGWFALVLAAFDPNLIAHSAVATPDIMVTFFILLAMHATWRYLQRPSRLRWIAIIASVGLAVATKHVALLLAPMIAIVLVERALVIGRREWSRTIGRALVETAAVAALALGLGAIIFGTRVFGGFLPLLQSVRDQLWHLGHLPKAYLHGAINRGGWWSYYLVVVALKIPLGTLALVAISSRWRTLGTPLTRGAAMVVVVPAVVVIGFITWSRIDLGIRLILPAIPFVIVLASRAATISGVRWRRMTVVALFATIGSSALATTRELGYFNECARVLGGGASWLSDSNLDWGQDLNRLDRYLRETDAPPIYLAYFGGGSPTWLGIRHATLDTAANFPPNADLIDDRSEPAAPCEADRQLVAISRFRQQGITEASPTSYDWLSRLTPIAELGTSIRVYDVTNDAESHVRLSILLDTASPAGDCERRRAIALDPKLAARFSHTR